MNHSNSSKPPPRPRTAGQLADRRQSILRHARALAADAGWDAVTMRAVAARVGLSPPALDEQFAGIHQRLEFVFATDATPPQVRRGFAVLRGAISSRIGDDGAGRDVELVTESLIATINDKESP